MEVLQEIRDIFFVSEHLRTPKIPCWECVQKLRVHKIGVFSEKKEAGGTFTVFEYLG